MTFEEWWTEPAPQTGNSYQDVYGDASGIVRLAFEAGQRAEREACAQACERVAASWGFHAVAPSAAHNCAKAIRNRKEQG